MKKHLYEIKKLEIPAYLKWWFIQKKFSGILSEIMENLSSPITLTDSLKRRFKIFKIGGNSIQDGEPSPTNEVPIKNVGDNINIFNKSSTPIYKDQVETQEIETGVRVTTRNTGTFHIALYLLGTVTSLKGKEITVSANIVPSSSNLGGLGIILCDADGSNRTAIAQKNRITGKQSLTAKIDESYDDNKVIALRLYSNLDSAATGDYVDYTELKVEEGTVATPYSPDNCGNVEVKVANGTDSTVTGYKEQTVTFPLEEGQVLHEGDTIEDKIVQRRKTIKLNINQFTSSSFENGTLILTNIRNSIGYYKNISGLCSHFQNANNNNIVDNGTARSLLQDNQYNFRAGNTTNARDRIYFKNSAFTTVEAWKNFFDNNEVTLEYELETPIETEFTSSQAAAKAQIDKLISYKGTTYISSTNEPSPLFTIQYVKEET